MTVNPYQSPNETIREGIDDKASANATQIARSAAVIGTTVGATVGAATGVAALAGILGVWFFEAIGTLNILGGQVIPLAVGMAVLGAIFGMCDGSVAGAFVGIIVFRLPKKYEAHLFVGTLLGLGWIGGYQGHVAARLIIDYLTDVTSVSLGRSAACVAAAVIVGGLGGMISAYFLVRNVLRLTHGRRIEKISKADLV